MGPCRVDGCLKQNTNKYCSMHEMRKRRTGNPLGIICFSCKKMFESRESCRGKQLCLSCLDVRLARPGWLERREWRRLSPEAKAKAKAKAKATIRKDSIQAAKAFLKARYSKASFK